MSQAEGASVLSSDTNADLNILSPCNHEEADTRVILHTLDAARKGASKILIRTDFANKGKLSAWKTWEILPDITLYFQSLMINSDSITTEFHKLERFVSILYDKTNGSASVNKSAEVPVCPEVQRN
ncbi:hypothetical protein E2C01_016776 [Portunus trituberculatus]|uniref:Uncharacterized protein n=1 Tax=Portunus trituberculatus TaxID=210409 RepID=A0A5B7DS29_PORTR|nr:hypothetical protein [Portunus trituberculatus]